MHSWPGPHAFLLPVQAQTSVWSPSIVLKVIACSVIWILCFKKGHILYMDCEGKISFRVCLSAWCHWSVLLVLKWCILVLIVFFFLNKTFLCSSIKVKLTSAIWLLQLVISSLLIHALVWHESSPDWDLNKGLQHERQMTYQLSYPSPLGFYVNTEL